MGKNSQGENGPYLRNLGLGIADLSPEELAYAQNINSQKLGYSLTECFSLTIANNRNYPLISENALLCTEIEKRGGMGHGLLWIISLMLSLMPTHKKSVLYGLEIIRTHPNYLSISAKAGDLLSKLKAVN
ncbi:hypothetical protein [Methylomonas sp. 11b]|uniref:hypothetical protein n=1 Tax=Methylomonas sp. 11b TaxID=1168169 RepID=UPI000478AA0A|nr:hypothetical protein [Methylomonas sp. 11b]